MLRRWKNLRLQNKLVLSMALISALLTGAALLIIRSRVYGQINQQIAQQVEASLAAYQNFENRSQALSASAAALVASVPSLEAAMSTQDARTVQDSLAETSTMLPAGSVLALADRNGRALGSVPARNGLNLADAQALLRQDAGSRAPGWWQGGGRLLRVYFHPIYRGPPADENLVGTLALGQEVDRTLAEQISQLAAGDVVFSINGQPVVSSLDPDQERRFAAAGLAGTLGMRSGVRLGGDTFAVGSVRLPGAGPVTTLTVLRSFGPAQAFLQGLNQLILLVGLAALAIGAGLVFVIARAFTYPLSELVTGVRALEAGDFSFPLQPGAGDEAGELTAAFARMRASLEQSQQRLLHAARMQAVGQLAGGVAHDFNNLITVINGFSQLMMDRAGAEDPNRRYLQQIQQAGERAAAVTRQLLVFSRKDTAQPRPLQVNPVIAAMHKMLAMLIGEGIELVLRAGPDLPPVRLDPTHLEQMIMNFAANARDAMAQSRGGTLTIATEAVTAPDAARGLPAEVPPGVYVQIEARDTGSGMDAETQRHIFEPFYTTKEVGKGTGLGLATIYGIVQSGRGHIFVESAVGKGTCFRVLLPSCAGEADAEAVEAERPLRPGAGTILLVEDEPGLRAMAREALEGQGYRVLEAGNGVEALELAVRHAGAMDLVFTDVVMPKMGGAELIQALAERWPRIPVLYTSGYTEQAISDSGVNQANAHFLAKPFTPAALLRKIESVLRSGGAARSAGAQR